MIRALALVILVIFVYYIYFKLIVLKLSQVAWIDFFCKCYYSKYVIEIKLVMIV